MPAKGGTGIASPAGLSGDITTTVPLPVGAGEERRRRGRGGGERRAVHDEIPAECMFGTGTPGLRPPRALAPRTPLLRGSLMEGPVWFSLPGRGFPPRSPPRVISPRSGVWDDAGERHTRDRLPRPAFPGISRLLPPPTGAGERGERCMARCRRGIESGPAPRALTTKNPCTKSSPKTPSDHNIRVGLHVFAADRRRVVAGGERECKANALIHDLRLHIG